MISFLFQLFVDAFSSDIMKIITGLSAIFGLIISVINFFVLQRERMMNLTIRFENVSAKQTGTFYTGEEMRVAKFSYHLSNYSQLPVAITRIEVFINGKNYDTEPRSYLIEHSDYKTNGKTITEERITNDILPIQLNALGAKSGYVVFLIPKNEISGDESTFTFRICTNRSKPYIGEFDLREEMSLKNGIFNVKVKRKRHIQS